MWDLWGRWQNSGPKGEVFKYTIFNRPNIPQINQAYFELTNGKYNKVKCKQATFSFKITILFTLIGLFSN